VGVDSELVVLRRNEPLALRVAPGESPAEVEV
jgi:hypothetical protein